MTQRIQQFLRNLPCKITPNAPKNFGDGLNNLESKNGLSNRGMIQSLEMPSLEDVQDSQLASNWLQLIQQGDTKKEVDVQVFEWQVCSFR